MAEAEGEQARHMARAGVREKWGVPHPPVNSEREFTHHQEGGLKPFHEGSAAMTRAPPTLGISFQHEI